MNFSKIYIGHIGQICKNIGKYRVNSKIDGDMGNNIFFFFE